MNTLNKNLELRKALAEVDRLTSENVDLKKQLDTIRNTIVEKDFDWCNDSGYEDVFNNSICECTAPQVNDGMCICGRPL
tara:strand:+ start:199 stop:435 length:237 start_codon:yes stop_codon:yes gene_type:complete